MPNTNHCYYNGTPVSLGTEYCDPTTATKWICVGFDPQNPGPGPHHGFVDTNRPCDEDSVGRDGQVKTWVKESDLPVLPDVPEDSNG